MENLEVKVKDLVDENERLKGENTKLLTRIHTLEMEVGDQINTPTKNWTSLLSLRTICWKRTNLAMELRHRTPANHWFSWASFFSSFSISLLSSTWARWFLCLTHPPGHSLDLFLRYPQIHLAPWCYTMLMLVIIAKEQSFVVELFLVLDVVAPMIRT